MLAPAAAAGPGEAKSEASGETRKIRQLVFPANVSHGDLYTFYSKDDPNGLPSPDRVMHERGKFLARARGTVNLPASKLQHIYFFPSYDLIDHPQVLNTITPSEIDCIAFYTSAVLVPIEKMMEPIAHLTGLRRLDVDAAELTDDQIAPLKSLPNLEYLSAVGNSIHGGCLKDFACRNKIRMLDLSFNPLSRTAIAEISQFKNLETLHLAQCNVTDKDVVEISKLTRLADLAIGQSLITVKSLNILKKMKSLYLLDLNGTKPSVRDLLVLKGSSLGKLKLAPKWYSPEEMTVLKAGLPNIKISVPKVKGVNSDTKTLFAPLH